MSKQSTASDSDKFSKRLVEDWATLRKSEPVTLKLNPIDAMHLITICQITCRYLNAGPLCDVAKEISDELERRLPLGDSSAARQSMLNGWQTDTQQAIPDHIIGAQRQALELLQGDLRRSVYETADESGGGSGEYVVDYSNRRSPRLSRGDVDALVADRWLVPKPGVSGMFNRGPRLKSTRSLVLNIAFLDQIGLASAVR